MPKVYVTEHDVPAKKTMQDRTETDLKLNEAFRHEVNLHIPLNSRKLLVKLFRSDVSRVQRLPILKAHIDYPSDAEASFEAHLNSPEVYITILHWLNATYVVATNTHVRPADLAKQFESCPRNKVNELPAFFFVGDPKKSIRSQRITTVPAVARQLQAA